MERVSMVITIEHGVKTTGLLRIVGVPTGEKKDTLEYVWIQ
jgi:hypothetical protein